jgi:hypothetical protein
MPVLEHTRFTILCIVVGVAAVVLIVVGGSLKLICRESLMHCPNVGELCPGGTMCTDYGEGRKRCSPTYCAQVRDCCEIPPDLAVTIDAQWKKARRWILRTSDKVEGYWR